MLEYFLLFLAGALTKFVDSGHRFFLKGSGIESVLGLVNGLVAGFLVSHSPEFSAVVLAVVVSCLFAEKIDSLGHYFAVLGIAVAVGFFGFSVPVLWIALALAVFGFADELLHERKKQDFLKTVGEHRLAMLACALALSIWTGNIVYFIALFAFDFGYNLSARFLPTKN